MAKRGAKPLPKTEKKISHHFKLKPFLADWLTERSHYLGITKTEHIENLLTKDLDKNL